MLPPIASPLHKRPACRPLGPSASEPAMPAVPVADLDRPPATGSLAWLLAYGLTPAALQRTTVCTSEALQHDPGVQQALRHAQAFHRDIPDAGRHDPRFASPGCPQPARPDEDSVRHAAYEVLVEEVAARCMKAMNVRRPDPEKRPRAVDADMKKILATAWLLDLPVDPKLAVLTAYRRNAACRWSTGEVFGGSREAVRAVVGRACADALAQLDADGLRTTDPLRPACRRAAGDLRDYYRQCMDRLYAMRAE